MHVGCSVGIIGAANLVPPLITGLESRVSGWLVISWLRIYWFTCSDSEVASVSNFRIEGGIARGILRFLLLYVFPIPWYFLSLTKGKEREMDRE